MKHLSRVLSSLVLFTGVVAAQTVNVTDLDALGATTTAGPSTHYMVSFGAPVTGVDVADFAPISSVVGATVTSVDNNCLDFRFGGGRPTRAVATGLVAAPSTAVTVEFWMATDDAGGTMFDYAGAAANVNDDEVRIRHSGGIVEFMIHNTVVCSSSTVVNDQSWHHIAATWSSATGFGILYIDGVQVATGTAQTGYVLLAGGAVGVGQDLDDAAGTPVAGENLYGRYDEVRLWNTERTSANIQNSMNRYVRPSNNVAELVLYWICDNADDLGLGVAGVNDLRDMTANGNHATFGTATTPQFLVGAPFDGFRFHVTVTYGGFVGCGVVMGLQVLNNGTITRISNGAPLGGPFSAPGLFNLVMTTPLSLPGTGDDLALLPVLVDGVATPCVGAGDFLQIQMHSPFGGMNWSIPFIVVQFYTPGNQPGSSFPGIQMNFAAPIPPIFILDGTTSLAGFGPMLLPPGGVSFGAMFPAGFTGFNFMIQGATIGSTALNTLYASTTAVEMFVL